MKFTLFAVFFATSTISVASGAQNLKASCRKISNATRDASQAYGTLSKVEAKNQTEAATVSKK